MEKKTDEWKDVVNIEYHRTAHKVIVKYRYFPHQLIGPNETCGWDFNCKLV